MNDLFSCVSLVDLPVKMLSQLAGFEPTRAEPIGFQVQRLNHSATTALCECFDRMKNGDTGDRTPGLSHAKRTLYHWATSPISSMAEKLVKGYVYGCMMLEAHWVALVPGWVTFRLKELIRLNSFDELVKIDLSMCLRPYHVENTSSRPITEVKQHWVALVLGWVTAWEYAML